MALSNRAHAAQVQRLELMDQVHAEVSIVLTALGADERQHARLAAAINKLDRASFEAGSIITQEEGPRVADNLKVGRAA